MPIRKIIAGVALEMEDDPVVGRALQLARQHGADLVFVHAVEGSLPSGAALPKEADISRLRDEIERNAEAEIHRLARDAEPQTAFETVVQVGRAYDVINAIAEKEKAQLIIIGPGKAKNIRERVFGSTADCVVRSSPIPILVSKAAAKGPYEHVIAAVDFSAPSRAALETAAQVAPEALIELVNVVEIPLPFEQAMRKVGTPQEEIDRYKRVKARDARRELARFVKDANVGAASPRLRAVHGAPAPAVIRQSRARRADLIAIGTYSRSVVAQSLLGSVARRVLQLSSCDVLVTSTTVCA